SMRDSVDDRFRAFPGRNGESFALDHTIGRPGSGSVRLEIRFDIAGENTHYMDAVTLQFATLGRSDRRQCELAGGIDGQPRQVDLPRDRTDVHDRAARLEQIRRGELSQRQWPEEVDFEQGPGFIERRDGSAVIR